MSNKFTKTETERWIPLDIPAGLSTAEANELIGKQIHATFPGKDYHLTHDMQAFIERLAIKAAYYDSGFKLSKLNGPDRQSDAALKAVAALANEYVKKAGLYEPNFTVHEPMVVHILLEPLFKGTEAENVAAMYAWDRKSEAFQDKWRMKHG
jgi:hypothetical protein